MTRTMIAFGDLHIPYQNPTAVERKGDSDA